MSQDLIGLNGGGGNVDSTVTNDAHLVVLIGQTNSSDEVKLTLSLLNAALTQIGKPVQEHLTDIVNAIRHKQYEKSSYDQQQRIGYSNDVNFTFELLVNPLVRSVRQSFKNALTSDRKLKYVVNLSGDRAIQGDVNCSDASISCDDLLIMLGDAAEFTDEQRKALKSAQKSFTLLVPQRVLEASRSWKAALEKQYTSISVQPINTAAAANENVELNESLTQLLNQTPIDQLLVTPPYTGTLKVTRPSLYIFPSEQGDAAYFALNGYSMLINGGYDRLRPSFWKFVNLLQQIDSVLLTHADVDALGGLVGLFGKKAADTAAECKPQVLTLLGNFVRSTTKHQADTPTIKTDVDVILDAVEKLNVRLMPLVKTNENLLLPFNKSASVPNKYEHINLYSKLGHGSLDLYVLSPFVNSPEYKEFYLQQQQSFARQTSASANLQKAHLAVHGVYKHLPLSHLATSVCLLVWLPAAPTHRQSAADPAHNALRLLFTGNAPQHVILNALDKLKDFELLNEPIYRVKAEPAPHQPIQSLKKQTSASGVGGKTESSSTNGKLNTSISSKPVGTANGHHTDHHDEKEKDIKQPIKSSKPPVPSSSSTHNTTAAAAKPSQPSTKSTTTKSTSASSALNTSVSKDVKDGAASGKHEKKPPVNNSASSQAKKKPEHSEDKEKSGTDKVVTASSEKPKEAAKKTGPVGKKETPATNGSGPVKSETSTNSRASLSKAADNKEKEKPEKPEAKPPVPKQQPAKSSTTASKPPAGDAKHESKDKPSGHKTETKPDSGKKSLPSSKPPSTTAATKKTSTGGAAAPKTLTLSMTGGDGSVIKGGVVAAAAAATASVVAATVAAGVAETPVEQQTPTPNVESVVVSQEATSTQQQQCPSSVESVEMRLHQNEEEVVATESAAAEEVASSQQPSSDIIQQIEQVEQIEKIEQVVNVEHVVEEILPPTTTTTTTIEEEVVTTPTQEEQVLIEQPPVENQSQEEEGDVASSNNYAHESPNLSPVKKDFPTLNHSQHVEAPESTSESAVVNEIHEHHHHEEPVVEEQLTSEAVTTNDIEIVSGNLNGDAALEEVSEQLRAANEDVMTRSFIEDASNPASNPFAAPLIPTTNGENGEQTNGVQTNGTNGNHHLDESCDLNRTHELFEGDESSSSLLSQQAPSQTNGNGVHGDGSVGEEINGGTNGTNGTNGLDKHEESLISSLEALKLANQSANHHVEATNGAGEPHTWNLLELPKPVNPADNGVIDPSNVDLVHDKVEIDSKPDATSSPAGGQQSVSAAIGSDKKPIANGKGSGKAPNRNSVDPSSKPATQNNNTNSNSAPSKPSKPIHPAYVELAYIPAHGAESHVDAEFFKRVRARHYVLSALEPNEHALNALCEGKEVWEDKQLSVTLVPTYESEALRKWFMVNEERLQRLKIDITPAAQHANITIDDNPDLSCQVYKLEF